MAGSSTLIIVAGMAVVTYLTRLPLYFLARHRPRLPALLGEVLKQIPAAAFASIVFTGVLQPAGHTDLRASNLYLYAAAATVATAAIGRRGLLTTILVGMSAAIVLRQLVG